ncbi:MAG: hypothetical protein CVU36_12625 [Betaproteobacteria bacterium HGW-Betaproteobacteria-9]|jgi:hypothetical protein|nr:MAG: hypothetical protein CVU36_12625 [Betaproteobacteria bacterium HGW-Betaproteobacteria-9]
MDVQVGTVELTPTWGEISVIVRRLAFDGKQQIAVKKIWPEAARAFAAAEALQRLMSLLSDDQKSVVANILVQELGKQGY